MSPNRIRQGIPNIPTLLASSRKIAPNAAERLAPRESAKTPSYFLLQLDHAHPPFSQIVRKGYGKIVHEPKYIFPFFYQAIQR
jgi:hypothetical protein